MRELVVTEMHLSPRSGNVHILLHSCRKCLLHFLPDQARISISFPVPMAFPSLADSYDSSYRALSAWGTAPSAGCPQEDLSWWR